MNQDVTLYKIIKLFEDYQQSQRNIGLNGFGYGNLIDFGQNLTGGTQTNYPFMFVTPQNISYDENITTYTMSIIFADRLNDDKSNMVDVQSDMSIQAKRLMGWIKRGINNTPDLFDNMDINLPTAGIPFLERFNDYVGGIAIDLEVVVQESIDSCNYYVFCPPTVQQYMEIILSDSNKFKLALWEEPDYTQPTNALCDYVVSGTAYGSSGTTYTGTEIILDGQHQHNFNLASVLQPGEDVTGFTVYNVNTSTCQCPVNVNFVCREFYVTGNYTPSGFANPNGTYKLLNDDTGVYIGISNQIVCDDYLGDNYSVWGLDGGTDWLIIVKPSFDGDDFILTPQFQSYPSFECGLDEPSLYTPGARFPINITPKPNGLLYPQAGTITFGTSSSMTITYPTNCSL